MSVSKSERVILLIDALPLQRGDSCSKPVAGVFRKNLSTPIQPSVAVADENWLTRQLNSFVHFIGGAFRSKPDASDFHAEKKFHRAGASAVRLPEVFDLRPQLMPIRNQGEKQGTCVAQCGAAYKEWVQRRGSGARQYFSPQFIYNFRDDQQTSGMSARDLMKILQKIGDCYEKTYPYGTIQVPSQVPATAVQEANQNRITTYGQVSSVSNLKRAIYEHGPCVMLVPCYNYESSKMWIPSSKEEQQLYERDDAPGHAFAVVGWRTDALILRNSWGASWGDHGYTYFPFEDWRPDRMWEAWMFVDSDV